MQTVETVRLVAEAPGALEQAVEALEQGKVIAFPTDTVYGVGAHAFQEAAVADLFVIKERPIRLPLPLLLPDAVVIESVCTNVPPLAWQLAERFWPGGLSLVLHRSSAVPDSVTAGGSTVAVRVPDNSLVRELCRRLDAPLAATSANRHGQPAPVTADEAEAALRGRIPLLLDGGRCTGGLASTVVDLSVWPPVLLRPGPVTARQLAEVLPLAGDTVPRPEGMRALSQEE
jgi:L-threonylcarbamoyladenylate synthase